MKKLMVFTLATLFVLAAAAMFSGSGMATEKLNAGDSMFMVPDRFIPVAEPVVKPAGDPLVAGEIARLSNGITDFTGKSYDDPALAAMLTDNPSIEGSSAGGPRAVEVFKDLYNGITDFSGRSYDHPGL